MDHIDSYMGFTFWSKPFKNITIVEESTDLRLAVGSTASLIIFAIVCIEGIVVWSNIISQTLCHRVHCLVHRQVVNMPDMVSWTREMRGHNNILLAGRQGCGRLGKKIFFFLVDLSSPPRGGSRNFQGGGPVQAWNQWCTCSLY